MNAEKASKIKKDLDEYNALKEKEKNLKEAIELLRVFSLQTTEVTVSVSGQVDGRGYVSIPIAVTSIGWPALDIAMRVELKEVQKKIDSI